jgi:hypothetical protein
MKINYECIPGHAMFAHTILSKKHFLLAVKKDKKNLVSHEKFHFLARHCVWI